MKAQNKIHNKYCSLIFHWEYKADCTTHKSTSTKPITCNYLQQLNSKNHFNTVLLKFNIQFLAW